MEFLSLFQKFNIFDILFIIASSISLFLAIKNGFIKSILNLFKWVLIIYIIKNSFSHLRPFLDNYIQNQTLADIVIFISVAIISFIFLSIIVRVLDAIIQPRISGPIEFSLSAIMGLVRAYIIFALIIFFVNTSISINYVSNIIDQSELIDLFNMGISIIGDIPKRIDEISLLWKI